MDYTKEENFDTFYCRGFERWRTQLPALAIFIALSPGEIFGGLFPRTKQQQNNGCFAVSMVQPL
jgi:hypothetical protein